MENNNLTGFRKRQQVTQTNKNIFAWVAGASVVITICVMLAQVLIRQAIFNQEVISMTTTADTTLKNNITNATKLKENINKLVADTNLAKVKTQAVEGGNSSNLQVILDALPTKDDGVTFANSLAKVILPRSGVSIEGLTAGYASAIDAPLGSAAATPQTLSFSMTVSGSYDQLDKALSDIGLVIRPINIKMLTIQGSDNDLKASIDGVTYYAPSASVKVETVKKP